MATRLERVWRSRWHWPGGQWHDDAHHAIEAGHPLLQHGWRSVVDNTWGVVDSAANREPIYNQIQETSNA